MRPLERQLRGHALSGALLLCLTLVGVGSEARSASASLQEARPVMAPAMVSMADAKPRPMPGLADCAPCAGCYIAPAPSTHGFSGEGKASEAQAWHVQAVPLPTADWWLDSGGERPRLPVRIAFCRWLN